MHKKAWFTCGVVVLLNKPIASLMFFVPSLLSLLKLSIIVSIVSNIGVNTCIFVYKSLSILDTVLY